jgi:LmbE family N-acetylglucosaminyl deacetylase
VSQTFDDGYACVPYTHDHKSIEIKESWQESKDVENMYFVTATFSQDSKPYFPSHANHYLLAKFAHDAKITADIEKHSQEKTAFVFNMNSEIFERDVEGTMNFVSVYYLEYSKSEEDLSDLAMVVSKNDRVRKASTGSMMTYSSEPPRFTFPYQNNIVVLEVSSQKSHQSVNKYCEMTRRNICRKGITMTNLVGLSILEKLK